MFLKKLKLWIIATLILLFYISTIYYYFWMEENRRSITAEVKEFSYCDTSNPRQKIDVIERARLIQEGGVFVCGILITDDNPAFIDIYVFFESQKKPVYKDSALAGNEPGLFEEFVPLRSLSETGLYTSKVYFGRGVLATAELRVVETP